MAKPEQSVRVGVDVGGTFTDVVLLNESDGSLAFHKTPSTPADPAIAIVQGVTEILARERIPASAVLFLGHGTTVATNMIIERRGARTALITTRGFRDVLEIGRQTRPHLYDYSQRRPPPLARRSLRFEVNERLASDGCVDQPLDSDELADIVRQLQAANVEAVAVCLLHAYRNAAHEIEVEQAIVEALPDIYVCRSSEVLAEFREFERTSTTVMNAFVGPRVAHYMGRLDEQSSSQGIAANWLTIQSNGGLMSSAAVRRWPVRTCLSGPAAGVVAAALISNQTGENSLIAFDVGGTSTDVSLVLDGKPVSTSERLVAGYPVRTPSVDVQVIGAGGGSIARLDAGGSLKVGPESAGAFPGPVAYGNGATEPTLTDASIVLGRLNPTALLAGAMPVDAVAARKAIENEVARGLNISVDVAALGIVDIAVANIARAIQSVTSARGLDPRSLALLAYGGAGPVLAVSVAREVQCPRVVIPVAPGTLCANGILQGDMAADFVKTVAVVVADVEWGNVRRAMDDLSRQGDQWLAQEGVEANKRIVELVIEARYDGQSFEVPVDLDATDLTADDFVSAFHAAYKDVFGYALNSRTVMAINVRARAIGMTSKPQMLVSASNGHSPESHRPVFISQDKGWEDTTVIQRDSLNCGDTVSGPAVIEELTSTVYLGLDDKLIVDEAGNLIIEVGEG
ncbi:MAG: hydantoinase/oxoprolinase family protein [Gammaproteobacteria bacterium]